MFVRFRYPIGLAVDEYDVVFGFKRQLGGDGGVFAYLAVDFFYLCGDSSVDSVYSLVCPGVEVVVVRVLYLVRAYRAGNFVVKVCVMAAYDFHGNVVDDLCYGEVWIV